MAPAGHRAAGRSGAVGRPSARGGDDRYVCEDDSGLLSLQERSALIRRWYELMIERKKDLATIITAENVSMAADGRQAECSP